MVRVPLEELVLQIQLLRLGPAATFLGRVIEPPPLKSIQAAVAQLQAVKALAADETLTALGKSRSDRNHVSPHHMSSHTGSQKRLRTVLSV